MKTYRSVLVFVGKMHKFKQYEWLKQEPHNFLLVDLERYVNVPLVCKSYLNLNLPFDLCLTCAMELRQNKLFVSNLNGIPSPRTCSSCYNNLARWIHDITKPKVYEPSIYTIRYTKYVKDVKQISMFETEEEARSFSSMLSTNQVPHILSDPYGKTLFALLE